MLAAAVEMSSGGEEMEKENTVDKTKISRQRITYTREFLLSVAGSKTCRDSLPAGVDASMLRSMAGPFIYRSSLHHLQEDTSSSNSSSRLLRRRKVVAAPDAPTDGPRGDLPPQRAPGVTESFQTTDGSKSKPCTRFFSTAGCCFGGGCRFLHYLPDNGHQTIPKMNNLSKKPNPGMATPASFGASATAKISFDASLTGAIIGRGGASIKHMSQVTGAKLAIRDHESDTSLNNIELEGTFDQIKDASTMIKELIVSIGGGGNAPLPVLAKNGCKFRTRLCEPFARGSCTYGDRCRFAHGEDELRKYVSSEVDPPQNFWAHDKELIVSIGGGGNAPLPVLAKNGCKFRTRLCEHFASGSCTYGDRCRFAHGEDELRKYVSSEVDSPQNFWAHDEFPSRKGGW